MFAGVLALSGMKDSAKETEDRHFVPSHIHGYFSSFQMDDDWAIRSEKIQSGNTVLLKLPNGDIRSTKIEQDTYGQSLDNVLTSANQHF